MIEYAAKNFYKLKNTEIEIVNSKPRFKHIDNLHFSISHSKNTAAACFHHHPAGFDIEFIKPRDYKPIAERLNFKLQENTLEEFYKLWTRYEAEYKLQQKPCRFHTEKFQEEYIMSAASSCDEDIKFRLLQISEI